MIKTRSHLLYWWIRDYIFFKNRIYFSFFLACLAHLLLIIGIKKFAFKILFFADRFGGQAYTIFLIKKYLKEIISYSVNSLGVKQSDDTEWIKKRCLILKPAKYSGDKLVTKGCLLVKFSNTFPCLYRALDCKKLLHDYVLVLEPSWAGYALPETFVWLQFSDSNVIMQASDYRDRYFLHQLEANIYPISIGSSDWVDSEVFYPIAGEKKIYDAIFITNYNSIKRHYVLFRTIDKLRREKNHLRIAMVCANWGQDKDVIINLTKIYTLNNTIDLYEQLPQKEINILLNRSKVNVLLSLKEGSNRSLFEGMFADVPAILLSDNVGVNRDYINQHTGLIVDEKKLGEALVNFRNNTLDFSPRKWAMANISADISTKKLENKIREIGIKDIGALAVKVNRPEARYKNETDEVLSSCLHEIIMKFNN